MAYIFRICSLVKFIFSKNSTKIEDIFTMIWRLLHSVKSTVKISSISLNFLEYIDERYCYLWFYPFLFYIFRFGHGFGSHQSNCHCYDPHQLGWDDVLVSHIRAILFAFSLKKKTQLPFFFVIATYCLSFVMQNTIFWFLF